MVAYSFQPQFVRPILDGTKRQTIRAERRRHARPGEELQLYTGMRTKQCRLITKAVCIRISAITLDLKAGRATVTDADGMSTAYACIDNFARRDGFASFEEMRGFWAKHHPGVDEFTGVLIAWDAAYG